VVLTGVPDQVETAAEVLREAGVTVDLRPSAGPLRARWSDEGA
jgi:hypothetical protein